MKQDKDNLFEEPDKKEKTPKAIEPKLEDLKPEIPKAEILEPIEPIEPELNFHSKHFYECSNCRKFLKLEVYEKDGTVVNLGHTIWCSICGALFGIDNEEAKK